MAAPQKLKRGFLNAAEKEYADRHRGKKTAEQIGAHLRRSPRSIENHFARRDAEPPATEDAPPPSSRRRMTLASELRNRPEWRKWEKQFTAEELDYFKYQYVQLINQYGHDDILPTEEMQIFSLITLDILIGRTLAEQKVAGARLERLHTEMEGARRTEKRAALEAEFVECRKVITACAARHDSFEIRKNATLRDLKSTRDQRVRVVEGSRQSFVGLLKRLMADEEFRAQAGFEAGSMALAMAKEKARLAAPHRYEDGTWDQPLLTPETVLEEYNVPDTETHPGDS